MPEKSKKPPASKKHSTNNPQRKPLINLIHIKKVHKLWKSQRVKGYYQHYI
jgi:hypothetical protein